MCVVEVQLGRYSVICLNVLQSRLGMWYIPSPFVLNKLASLVYSNNNNRSYLAAAAQIIVEVNNPLKQFIDDVKSELKGVSPLIHSTSLALPSYSLLGSTRSTKTWN
jgi:hypothetical protein